MKFGSSDVDPSVRQFLIAALTTLDDVETDDRNFWPAIMDALGAIDEAFGQGDRVRVRAAVDQLDRVLNTRAIPVGSQPTERMPDHVREIRVVIEERARGSASTATPKPPQKDKR